MKARAIRRDDAAWCCLSSQLPLAGRMAVLLGQFVAAVGYCQVQWIPQGPAPITTSGAYANVSGAIETILVDPSVQGRAFIGAVNGGIWRTTNLNAPNPNWTPLTDQMDSLSIADIQFSRLDLTYNTLFAGVGGYSSAGGQYTIAYNANNGPLIGLLKSTDGGDTWVNVARSTLGGRRIRNVIPTGVIDPTSLQQVVLVAARNDGVFRSTDGGNTFTRMSGINGLPSGDASHLVADPVNLRKFYVAVPYQGVFVSTNAGLTWSNITGNLPQVALNGSDRIELTVSPAGSGPVYAALIFHYAAGAYCGSASPYDVFRWDGSTWTGMGLRANGRDVGACGSGCTHFAMLAHQTDQNVIFVTGDCGGVWRGTMGNWVQVDGSGANNTGPHSDSRDMVYDFNNQDILEASDGGLERLVNADSPARHWDSINGNLQITEFNFFGTAYDTLNHVVFGGTQDNGSPQQTSSASAIWGDDATGGDGTMHAVDNSNPNRTVRYYTAHGSLGTFGGEHLFRRDYDAANQVILINGQTTHLPKLADPTTSNTLDSGLKHGMKGGLVVNKVRPSRLLLFGPGLYEGIVDGSGEGNYGETINDITLPGQQGSGPGGEIAAYGVAGNPDLVYVSLVVSNSWGLYLRTNAGGAFKRLAFPSAEGPHGIAVDFNDWRRVYAMDWNRVYRSVDGGATWTNITGNLTALGVTTIESIELLSGSLFPYETVLVGGLGGVYRTTNPNQGSATTWSILGSNLPRTFATHMTYYPAAQRANGPIGDTLVVGTRGRGAWLIPLASYVLFSDPCFAYNRVIYADAAYSGSPPTGTFQRPFPTVRDAHNSATENCNIIRIKTGTYHETVPLTLNKHVRLEAVGGPATIRQ